MEKATHNLCKVSDLARLPEVAVLLNLIKISDEETYEHCVSVAKITEVLLEASKFSEQQRKNIVVGAMLHDVGKVFIPFNLQKLPRRLTSDEFAIIKTHTVVGAEIVANAFPQEVYNVVLYHHERPNGMGYVNASVLSDIPEEALLVQVADVYDALLSNREYKISYSPATALKIMEAEAKSLNLDDGYLAKLKKAVDNRRI